MANKIAWESPFVLSLSAFFMLNAVNVDAMPAANSIHVESLDEEACKKIKQNVRQRVLAMLNEFNAVTGSTYDFNAAEKNEKEKPVSAPPGSLKFEYATLYVMKSIRLVTEIKATSGLTGCRLEETLADIKVLNRILDSYVDTVRDSGNKPAALPQPPGLRSALPPVLTPDILT